MPIEGRIGLEGSGRLDLEMTDDFGVRQLTAEAALIIGGAQHDRAIGAEQRDRRVGAELDALEEMADVVEPQRADDDPGEASISRVERSR